MKKAVLTLGFCLLIGFQGLAGVVSIEAGIDSVRNPCQIPQDIPFYVVGKAFGYSPSDSLEVFIAFGDGQSISQKVSPFVSTGPYNWTFTIRHRYTIPGTYTVMYVITAPDLASDTLIVPNDVSVGATCGNVSGRAYIDNNNNCVYDGFPDVPLRHKAMTVKFGGQMISRAITKVDGTYSMDVAGGFVYNLRMSGISPLVPYYCPSSRSYFITALPVTRDFAVDCSNNQFDLETRYTSGFVVPGVARPISFRTVNNQCKSVSGVVKVVLNSQVSFVPGNSSFYTVPDSINGDTLYFSFDQLSLTDDKQYRIRLMGDTTLTTNEKVCISFYTEPVDGDSNPVNNEQHPCLEIRTSYDPNMKTVYPAGDGPEGYVAADLEMMYTLHFQNTGNFQAYNVFILDSIDIQALDLNSLEIVDYSHPVNLRVLEGGVLKFEFDNIMLPDSNSNEPESHGYVSFTIKQQPSLPDGTRIENKVGIYFDYNPPVITNTVLNTIDRSLSSKELKKGDKPVLFQVYPNPTKDILNVRLEEDVNRAQIKLYDLNGRILLKRSILQGVAIDVSQLSHGVYLLSVSSDEGSRQQSKIVVQ